MKEKHPFSPLYKFIKWHPFTWKKRLKNKPYCVTIKSPKYNKDWYMFSYNQFDSDFYNEVVKCCRGTVLEVKGRLFKRIRPICLPLKKFGNYGEGYCDPIDVESATIRDKVDGILVKCSVLDGRTYWFTNNGFDWTMKFGTDFSFDDGEEATKLAENFGDLLEYALYRKLNIPRVTVVGKYRDITKSLNRIYNMENSWLSRIPNNYTLCFELVSPRNRIICKYPETKVVFLFARDNITGQEITPEEMVARYGIPYETPKIYDCKTLKDVQEMLKSFKGLEQEGVVVCDKYFHRVKMKCESYLQLKYAVDNDKPKVIFKAVLEKSTDDLLAALPTLQESVDKMIADIENFKKSYKNFYDFLKGFGYTDKKEFAYFVNTSINPVLRKLSFNTLSQTAEEIADNFLLDCGRKSSKGYKEYFLVKDTLDKLEYQTKDEPKTN